jgi:coproporphyrinogen III oxidase-like Fe-S oxidoreductase
VEGRGTGETACTPLDGAEPAEEALMMGLRLAEGVETDRLSRLGLELKSCIINELENDGLLRREAGRIVATPRGTASAERCHCGALLGA